MAFFFRKKMEPTFLVEFLSIYFFLQGDQGLENRKKSVTEISL